MPNPSVTLLSHSPDPERTVAAAARLCYSPSDVGELKESMTEGEVSTLLGKLLGMGHFSALEHAVFTFGIEGISRACTHQLVRHRVASYSQQSQRYVKLEKVNAITPPSISKNPSAKARFDAKLEELWAFYGELVEEGVLPEDARYILPNACETKIVVTMNARELLHYFSIRTCMRAQWEIREMSLLMLACVLPVAPLLFVNAGPGCYGGKCPEGEYSCGKSGEVKEALERLKS
jgi:thymidylate synthase (FAD)